MTTSIAVFDLDGTLITRESMRWLMLRHPRAGLAPLVLGRLFRRLDAAAFTLGLCRLYAREFSDPAWVAKFCRDLQGFINPEIRQLIDKERKNANPVLLSASPQAYVGAFAQNLGMEGHGSHFDGQGRFFHCKGAGKLALLGRLYPQDRFVWRMAVSDAPADISLLKRFEIGYLYTRKRLQKVTP